ncbi:MAG: phosphoketolase family protein [Ilumatobacter sp.]
MSIDDLALAFDAESVLGTISAAPPDDRADDHPCRRHATRQVQHRQFRCGRDGWVAAAPYGRWVVTMSSLNVDALDRHWRAANYLSVGQIYLVDNPLLDEPLRAEHVKRRLLGHWGTTPGINFVLTHLQRVIAGRDVDLFPIIGPGHGGPAMLANTWLDGSYGEVYPDVAWTRDGLRRLFRQFSFPRGVPSHVAPETPGSMHEGGELGYSLAHAVGAAFDNPDLIVACIVGDGEAETGALAASWQSTAFLDPVGDGAVLPILHLNGWKIANPTVLARRSDTDIEHYFASMGWEPLFVTTGADRSSFDDHCVFATALDDAVDRIDAIRATARSRGHDHVREVVRWPMIVFRSPKGWTGPVELDGDRIEGTWRSHQVPIDDVRDDPDRRAALEAWLRSYSPHELFGTDGAPRPEVVEWLPAGDRRIGANPHANGGRVLRDLILPDHGDYAAAVDQPGASACEPTRTLGRYLRDTIIVNDAHRNFRIVGPDETASNHLDDVYAATGKAWQLPIEPIDDGAHLDPSGRVMEVLSEHLCQGWLEGYLLTGRHGLFSCYEAFVHIVDSMFNQHAKWLKVHHELEWRPPIASLNYLLTSHVWHQDHNGFSHQDPGFIDHVTNKSSQIVRVYLPPDTNTLLSVAAHCLASRDLVNVIVSGKQPTPTWFSADEADRHCARGAGILDFASNDDSEPDVVLACAGDVPTIETLAATSILRDQLPDLRIRVVNVVDLMRLQPADRHPHGLSDTDFDQLFTTNTPVIFAFHGYPWLIHRLIYRRTNHQNFHVHGYREEGSTTTPFDMVVRNDLDRFGLVIDVVNRVQDLGADGDAVRARMEHARERHVRYITEHGVDLPEVRDWAWST